MPQIPFCHFCPLPFALCLLISYDRAISHGVLDELNVDSSPISPPIFPPIIPMQVCAEAGDATTSLSALSVWGYTIVVLLLALLPIVLMVRNLRLARRAKAVRDGQTVLQAGPAVIEGQVDHPMEPPLRVEITQTGIESQYESGASEWHWTEMGRNMTVQPFRLKHPSGETIEVLANDEARLLLDMERTEQEGEKIRRRIAEVRDGNRIHVSGKLEVSTEMDPSAGYRGGATRQRWVLRPGAGGMLVSKRPIGDVFLHPIRYYGGALGLLALVLVIVHGLFAGYHARTHRGEVVAGEVTAKRVVRGTDDNVKHQIDLRLPEGISLQATPSVACYQRVTEGDRVPVLVSERPFFSWQIGRKPSADFASVIVGFIVLVGGMISYLFMLRASRRWHGGRLLDE